MAPRGLGVMLSMFFLGGIARRGYDTRPLVAFGFLLVAALAGRWGRLDLNMAMSNFIWPTVVQGIGMGLVFPNLSAVGAGLDSARADGLCGKPLFDDAQRRRVNWNVRADHDDGPSRAGAAEPTGRARVGV